MAPLLRELSPAPFSGTLGFALDVHELLLSNGDATSSIEDEMMHWFRFTLSLLPAGLLQCSKPSEAKGALSITG